MNEYIAFDSAKALEYVQQLGGFFADDAVLNCYEFGDGNLNLVFRIADDSNNSIILKQALPYARRVGESWPLTLDRARIEANVLLKHGAVCEAHTVKVLHQNDTLAVTILEDLGHLAILRGELNHGKTFPNLGRDVATYLATTAFYYSDFYLTPAEKKALVMEFTNPELCSITEDLFFDDPYRPSERNNYPKALAPEVTKLQANLALKLAVAKLKATFFSSPQALLHGDVHSGSIFVDVNTTKLIDPEFGFFGPIGFDLGSFIGNLLLNFVAQNGRISALPKRRDVHTYLLSTIQTTLSDFEQQFKHLAHTKTRDLALQTEGYVESFLVDVLQDAVGYCGTELVRRTIGLAHVSDIDGIEDDNKRLAAQVQALFVGQQLILNASSVKNKDDFSQLLLSLIQ
ncbi:S-methyl-5-thioribose kinase [Pseudoalteromonas xiamenensis]|uniref:Methylthioribose kinase n=1 Tax=Pseudoalteromonas xiamenensis TaxID=882626 RepID=A0A975DH43_9GAMM|nr:S-methyl-5-thioribose kinase [Pseudoalteromonas xiamenensis]QTH70191.1 S-methyl-5-thioribose kinase [Pseudoalteromonas xiamenensis]